ncbi:CDP-diacylglycerol--inositol 3-phosphatidyltransferase isoform X2 [Ahaetulla prasina]|uniref:CDP-diacylglycerol--inositol 3-phosphatidyltransferase isoform X2 n=1 Tax=Ahaetulla prasina TaxID=499056 RepID=UPI00264795A1|nr:CDP-diacylglycerol--inositol 3-phosphatidyltransferase isoform X2 [Ahaetulla prasina]
MKQENIFLFVPNLIGYARIILACIAFYYMPTSPSLASFFYLFSGFLDAFDGHAARALNQGTRFGAMLDMLTDRCTTMCLLVNLAMLYPESAAWFQLSMSLDVASHWLHLHRFKTFAFPFLWRHKTGKRELMWTFPSGLMARDSSSDPVPCSVAIPDTYLKTSLRHSQVPFLGLC